MVTKVVQSFTHHALALYSFLVTILLRLPTMTQGLALIEQEERIKLMDCKGHMWLMTHIIIYCKYMRVAEHV